MLWARWRWVSMQIFCYASVTTAVITYMRLTGVWKKQRAALAVDDLLDNCCILGEGPGAPGPGWASWDLRGQRQSSASRLGSNSGVRRETWMRIQSTQHGSCSESSDTRCARVNKIKFCFLTAHQSSLTFTVASFENTQAVSCSILHFALPPWRQRNVSVNSGDTQAVYK